MVSATLGAGAQTSSSQPAQPAAITPNQASLSVQARIKARREQRRATAIHDVYSHLYEAYVGGGYLRFTPGSKLQRLNEYSWNVGVTRYYNEKLGVTIDGRGIYGTAYLGNNQFSLIKPAISQYSAMIGPTYRFILQPKYSVSGRILVGGVFSNFYGDANGYNSADTGLYPDGSTLGASASVPFEYNITPNVGLRVAPEYFLTSFGSTVQNNLGFTAGLVIRWGKQ